MSRSPENRGDHALDELLAQAGWMRALARSLVADPVDADDVVQDAWVVALRERSAVRLDLASWLRAIVRNLALRRRGREATRPAVERRAARMEATGVQRDAVERMELQHWLASALLELDEPYRSAVILRHVDGLDSAEIGRRQGCSPAAARQRVARGLERLRVALDSHHGGRERWLCVLAPLAARPPASLAVPATTGGLVMGSKAVLGTVAALAAVAIVWTVSGRFGDGARSGRGSDPRASAPALPGERELASEAAPDADAPARESVVVAAPAAALENPADAAPPDPLLGRLTGRVLDPARAPVAGAEVVVRRPEVSHLSMLDVAARRAPREVARTTTGPDGRFAFELERGIPFDVGARKGALGEELATQRYAGEEVELVLGAGFRVHGKVTRQRDGAPIVDARVRVFPLGGSGSAERLARTGADGSYEVRFAFENATLEVTPDVEMSSGWYRLVPGADGSVRQDVVLADGIEVRGRVTDAATGAPIAGAIVGEGWTYRRSAETDAQGVFVMRGFGTSGVQELYARAPGYGQTQLANLPPASNATMVVDFELRRGRVVRGRVLGPDRLPLADAYVAAVASEDSGEGQRTDWISGRTDAGGRFELAGLTPELRHALLAGADGCATLVYDLPAEELELAEVDLDDLVLAPPAVLAGVVTDESGAPLAGMEVVLSGANRDRARWRGASELEPAGDWYVDSREATTDAAGRFWFGALPAGDFGVRARSSGQPDGPRVAVTLAEGELRDDFVLLYPRGEEVAGRVVDEAGRALEGVYVIASLRASRGGVGVDPQRARATARTDADGAFALRGLPPGTYRLDCHPFELEGDPAAPWLSTSLDAESGGAPLEVVLPRGATISGRVVDLSGAALVGYTVLARGPGSGVTPSGSTDEDGAFTIEAPAGTVWDLEVHGPWQTDQWETIFHTEPAVRAPMQALELRVDPRSHDR